MTTIDPNHPVAQSLSSDQFVSAALRNLARGWHPIPVGRVEDGESPPRYKKPWLKGLTGYQGHTANRSEIESWPARIETLQLAGASGILSLGARCPTTRIGIDVDQYGSKRGLDQLRELESQFGPLPPAPVVTARDLATGSGIRMFRVPDGWRGQTNPTQYIELIQWFHRYLVVPPSFHYSGNQYRRFRRDGQAVASGILPESKAIPLLPDDWLSGLAEDTAKAVGCDATAQEVKAFSARYDSGPQPQAVDWVIASTIGASIDDTRNPTRDALCWAAREAKGGRYGFAPAVEQIRAAAIRSYANRGQRFSQPDFDRSVAYAVGQVRELSEVACADRWQSDAYKGTKAQAVIDDDDPFGQDDNLLPSEYDVRESARRLLIRRAADRLVKEVEAAQLLAQSTTQVYNGVAFLEDVQPGEPVWGSGNTVAWAKNQGFMVFGNDGTGKSTLMQQVALSRLGLRDPDVLGIPASPDDRSVLYLALDRPTQIRESIARMVDLSNPDTYDTLKRRLTVIKGPVPFPCDSNPRAFVDWCLGLAGDDCGLVIVDSVKDMVSSPKEDVAGAGFNDTMQLIISRGIEFGCAHHNRKETQQNNKPRNLADVYGSRWLTAGMGAVLNIWRNEDGSRELTQLKTPYGNPFRPIIYADDYTSGHSKAVDNWQDSLVSHLVAAGVNGLTDAECVLKVFDQSPKDSGYEANRQKITRQITKWQNEGSPYVRVESKRGKVWRVGAPAEEKKSQSKAKTGAVRLDSTAERRRRKAMAELAEVDSKLAEIEREPE